MFVSHVVVEPVNPNVLYAAAGGYVFKSTNAGNSWAIAVAGFGVNGISSLAIDPAMPSTVYATSSDGVYRSTDGAGNWVLFSAGLEHVTPRVLAIDHATPTTVHLGTSGGVFTIQQLCGNGIVDAPEECDDGGANGTTSSCCTAICELADDQDGDGICFLVDVCPSISDPLQLDVDADGAGDACDDCPTLANPDQRNSDSQDGGDLCDACPANATDVCNPNATAAALLGTSGGTLTTPDGSVSITIPAGVLPSPMSVSITGGLAGSSYDLTANSRVLLAELQPEGVTFDPPVTITFAWVDADSDGIVDGTRVGESKLKIYRNGTPLFGSLTCESFAGANCTPASCCDRTTNTWSVQRDEFSEYALVRECLPVGGGRLTVTNVALPPGDDAFTFKGSFTLPAGTMMADVDPLTHGIDVILDEVVAASLSVLIPPGAFDPEARSGWTVNGTGTSWTFRDRTAMPPGGIVKAVIRNRPTDVPGPTKFVLKGRAGSYGTVTPLVVPTLVLPRIAACASARFAGPPPAPTCTFNGAHTKLKCK